MPGDAVLRRIYAELGVSEDAEFEDLTPDQMYGVYVALDNERREADKLSKRIGGLKSQLEDQLVEHMGETGTQSITLRGKTLYLARELWPTVDDSEERSALNSEATAEDVENARELAKRRLVLALKGDPETEHLVRRTFNYQTLRSWMLNDCELDEETMSPMIPEHLEGLLSFTERHRVKVVASRK